MAKPCASVNPQLLWERKGALLIEPYLRNMKDADEPPIALLDAEWLVRFASSDQGTRKRLLPRQLVPRDAFLPISKLKRALDPDSTLRVICVSHMWLHPSHPDPYGWNLWKVSQALQRLLENWGGPFGVIWDFASLHQRCRDENGIAQQRIVQGLADSHHTAAETMGGRLQLENLLFRKALQGLGTLFMHPNTVVFQLTSSPKGWPDTYSLPNGSNVASYHHRGWCYFESSLATLTKDSSMTLDLGRFTDSTKLALNHPQRSSWNDCEVGRQPPLSPTEFETNLRSKQFTSGYEDAEIVAGLYRDTFYGVFCNVRTFYYSRLGWGNDEVGRFSRLVQAGTTPLISKLCLCGNRISNAGAAMIANALPYMPLLRRLELQDNAIGDDGMVALNDFCYLEGITCQHLCVVLLHNNPSRLIEVVQASFNRFRTTKHWSMPLINNSSELEVLDLAGAGLGDRGLFELKPVITERSLLLTQLNLSANSISDSGARLVATLVSYARNLRELFLNENCIGSDGATALAKNIAAAQLYLEWLDLQDNLIGDEGMEYLTNVVSRGGMPDICFVSVKHNPAADEKRAALKLAITTVRRLKKGTCDT